MDTTTPSMTHLFDQLGLPSQPPDIARFIAHHRPLPLATEICDASFWTPAQADFLREKMSVDGQWVLVIDALNSSLREHPSYN